MDVFERLAAFLADELETDERVALERELAQDADLRRRLDAMRRADEALGSLPSPEPSEGFEARIDAAVAAELRDLLGDAASSPVTSSPATATTNVLGTGESFVARRHQRDSRPRRALVGVAAGIAVLAAGGVAVTQLDLVGGDDSDTMAMDAEADAGGEAGDESAALSTAPGRNPVLVDEDRALDDDALDALLAAPELEAVRGDGLDADAGRQLAAAFQSTLGADGGDADVDDSASEGADMPEVEEAPAEEESEPAEESAESDMAAEADGAAPELFGRDGRPLPAEAAGDVARCLDVLLDADRDAIPAYAELATYDGTDVIVFGLVTLDPATETFSRTEVWALDRATCQVLRFSQS